MAKPLKWVKVEQDTRTVSQMKENACFQYSIKEDMLQYMYRNMKVKR
jgi:hypothetical protein